MKPEKVYSSHYCWHTIPGMFYAWDKNGNRQSFNTKDEAIAHTQTGTGLQEYRGFHFSYPGRVFRNGVQVFTSHLFDTFEEAQKMIDASLRQTELTNFEERQINKYGDIAFEETEAADRMAVWVHEQAELQLMERESN